MIGYQSTTQPLTGKHANSHSRNHFASVIVAQNRKSLPASKKTTTIVKFIKFCMLIPLFKIPMSKNAKIPLLKIPMSKNAKIPLLKIPMSKNTKIPLLKIPMSKFAKIPLTQIPMSKFAKISLTQIAMPKFAKIPLTQIPMPMNATIFTAYTLTPSPSTTQSYAFTTYRYWPIMLLKQVLLFTMIRFLKRLSQNSLTFSPNKQRNLCPHQGSLTARSIWWTVLFPPMVRFTV